MGEAHCDVPIGILTPPHPPHPTPLHTPPTLQSTLQRTQQSTLQSALQNTWQSAQPISFFLGGREQRLTGPLFLCGGSSALPVPSCSCYHHRGLSGAVAALNQSLFAFLGGSSS